MSISSKRDTPLFVFTLCWLAYAISYLGRMNLSIAIPHMEQSGVASLGQLGLAGTLYFWSYGFGHLINGFMGDKVQPKKMIFLGLLISSLVNIGVTLVSFPVGIMVLWSINGFSLSMLWGPMIRLLGEKTPESRHSLVSLLMTVSIGVGTFIAWNMLGKVVESSGNWKLAFIIPALVCALFAILWWMVFPKSTEDPALNLTLEDHSQEKGGFLEIFLKTRLYLIIIAVMVQGMVKDGLTLWLPTLVQAKFPEEPAITIVNWLSLIPFINTMGILCIAIILQKKTIAYRVTSSLLFLGAAATLLTLIAINLSIGPTLILLSLLSFSIAFINSILLGLVPMQYKKWRRVSTVAGLLDFVAYFAAGVFSVMSGFLFQGSGTWNVILLFLFISMMVGTVAMALTKKKIGD